uniref:Enoyl reductase (ER) domain-containing protein n=1 Tax=Salix viminalis TaxID=40686 RepID=A0A6N2L430_SALVM
MKIKPGLSAMVTGGASGIGKALSLALGEKGIFVTVIDFSEEKGKEVASLIEKENAKFHSNLGFPAALFIRCDVSNSRDLAAAFEKHVSTYGGMDICINCAGIGNPIPFYKDKTDGTHSWKHTVNVNLLAVIDCTHLAINTMQAAQKPGVIINLGSASGLYPMYNDPIYAGSKGGVVMFTRSLVPYKRQGIRINVLCPEFVKTEMGEKTGSKFIDMLGGFIPMKMVLKGAFELISDESKAGSCLWITNRRGMEYWPTPTEETKYLARSSNFKRRVSYHAPVNLQFPQSYEKLVVHTLSHNFRNATHIVRTPLRLPIGSNQALVKVIYAGVNASDVNFSSGRYFSGKNQDLTSSLPFDAGFEAVGIVAAVGESVTDLKVGTPAALMTFGSYAEFTVVPAKHILPVPRPDPEVVALLTSGMTASIALEKCGQMKSGEAVLVTAAAGGTGQFAVQLAKLAGNTVVATCGGNKKAILLKQLGVDRVIDYKAEDVKMVLKKEFPKGIDIIYESVGGDMFDLCLNALAMHGRLIVIGMISQYQGEHGWTPANYTGLCEKILAKSQTVAGFFLLQHTHLWAQHLDRLYNMFASGKLKVELDQKRFDGVHSVADAVEYLHSGKSIGKVVICIDPTFSEQKSKL